MKKAPPGQGRSAAELEAHFEDLSKKLDRLRALYESFFMGVDRAPPVVARHEMNRLFVEMQKEPLKGSMQRFRYSQLQQRWVLLTSYWNRTMREIEAGTFRRDLAKAQRRIAQKGNALTEEEAIALGIPSSRAKAFVDRQNAIRARTDPGSAQPAGTAEAQAGKDSPESEDEFSDAPAVVAPRAVVPRAAVPGLSDNEVADFFRRYMDAHSLTGAKMPKVTLEQMKERLASEIPKILAEKNCSRVSLQVVVDQGKVRMRAKPEK